MKLTDLQETLFRTVVGEGSLETSAALVHSGALSGEDRLGIYAEMYWLRMRDSLRAEYPFIVRVLGDDDFDIMVARHIERRPSTHYSLGQLGVDFAATLRDTDLQHPWLPDLAALEWARSEAFLALDAPVLDRAALSGLTPETFNHSRLVTSPSLRLLEPAWDVRAIWRALDTGDGWTHVSVPKAVSPLIAWRNGFTVFHMSITAAEHDALKRAALGLDLPSVCAAFAEAPEPAQAAFTAIGTWAAEGILSDLALDPA